MAKILIIGGGVSGLSAGIYAQLEGHQATICEAGSVAGGNLTGWQRGEYHIDNCIHWLTGTNPSTEGYKMWVTLGALGGVEIIQEETLYTYEHDGEYISLYNDIDKLRREMLAQSPADAEETEAFIKAVKLIQGMAGIAGPRSDKGLGILDSIICLFPLYRYYSMSTGELAKRFKSPLLSGFITCFLGDDFGALALLVVFANFCGKNAGIPAGGSKAMAGRMAERFMSLGGQLYLNKKASKINVSDGSVRSVTFSDMSEIEADYFILTVDPATVFGSMLDSTMPHGLRADYKDERKKRFSCVHCAFSCDCDELPFSGDHIFELPLEYKMRLGTRNLVLREFTHDKSFAPAGKTVIQSMIFVDELNALRFIELYADKTAYERYKWGISSTIQEIIEIRFPSLVGKIKILDAWTPATYKRFINSEIGSFMSHTFPKRTLPTSRESSVVGIKNLLLATQWQQSPGGLPIAATLGREAIERIAHLEKKRVHKGHGEFKKAYSQ